MLTTQPTRRETVKVRSTASNSPTLFEDFKNIRIDHPNTKTQKKSPSPPQKKKHIAFQNQYPGAFGSLKFLVGFQNPTLGDASRDVLTMILATNAIDHLTAYDASSTGCTNCDNVNTALFGGIVMESDLPKKIERRRRVKRNLLGLMFIYTVMHC